MLDEILVVICEERQLIGGQKDSSNNGNKRLVDISELHTIVEILHSGSPFVLQDAVERLYKLMDDYVDEDGRLNLSEMKIKNE